jgi:Invasion associated locus B (IalB) protein
MLSFDHQHSLGVRVPLVLLATFLAASAASAQQPPAAAPAKPAAAKPEAKPAPAAPKAEPKPAQSAAAVVGEVQPTLIGQYGDWGAYFASPGGKKICFAIAKPKSAQTNPVGRKRDPIWLFVSDRPAENVHNEVSVIIGYPFKSPSDATAEIGSTKFAMYTLNDGAWIKNVAEEARMVEAMRKGTDLTVKGMSGHGTESTDQYALKGLKEAMDKADQECK